MSPPSTMMQWLVVKWRKIRTGGMSTRLSKELSETPQQPNMADSAATSSCEEQVSEEQSHTGLLALPAELRNKIYDLVFAIDTASQVALLDAEPPSKELILTCKQICAETRLLYQAAYRAFWRETTFTIALEFSGHHMFINRALRGLRTEDVENIQSLQMRTSRAFYSLEEGVWISMGAESLGELLAPACFLSVLRQAGYGSRSWMHPSSPTSRTLCFWPTEPAAAKELLKGRNITKDEIVYLAKSLEHWA